MTFIATNWMREAEGVNDLRSSPKIRDHDNLWEQIRLSLDPKIGSIVEYGQATNSGKDYTLRAVEVGDVTSNPAFIVVSGTHGYESSAIKAVNRLINAKRMKERVEEHGLLIFPDPFPIAYEHDLRFIVGKCGQHEVLVDTNRDVFTDPAKSLTEEARYFSEYLLKRGIDGVRFSAGFDGHETPDTDVTVWRPFAEKYKGRVLTEEDKTVPQGAFVIVQEGENADDTRMQAAFGRAVIDEMREHTPIAPEPTLLGYKNDFGVAVAPPLEGSMRSFLRHIAPYAVVSECYPDLHELVIDPERVIDAQLSGMLAAMDFAREA